MLSRFANVVYWFCNGLAILAALLALAMMATPQDPHGQTYFGPIFCLLFAAACFGIGRGVRYVICGR